MSGNLELTYIDEELDLGFLQQIREVTGYVLISHVRKRQLSLPSLRIIRGQGRAQSLYNGKYSFAVIVNGGLEELLLPSLRGMV